MASIEVLPIDYRLSSPIFENTTYILYISGLAPNASVAVLNPKWGVIVDGIANETGVAGPMLYLKIANYTIIRITSLEVERTILVEKRTFEPCYNPYSGQQDDYGGQAPSPCGTVVPHPNCHFELNPVLSESGSNVMYVSSMNVEYGHWTGSMALFKIEEGDPAKRYTLTKFSFLGAGYSNSNPVHLETDVYQCIDGYKSSGAVYIIDVVPTKIVPHHSEVSLQPANFPAFSWSQTRPGEWNYLLYRSQNPVMDIHCYLSKATRVGSGQKDTSGFYWYTEAAASGDEMAWSHLRILHRSTACGFCMTSYVDDTGWVALNVTWKANE